MHDTALHTEPGEVLAEPQNPDRKATALVRDPGPALATDPSRRVVDSVFEMLPSMENPSPLVRINRLNTIQGFELYAELERLNPFGSVNDRAAWAMLHDLELRGQVGHGRGMVEPTSGNTGISLAAMARARGLHSQAIVSNKVPLEKKVLLKIVGLCSAPRLGDGSINLAKTHAKASPNPYVMLNQYENPKNVEAHYQTTGPEIWRQTDGQVTHVFASLGACGRMSGTMTGVGQSTAISWGPGGGNVATV